MKSSFIRRIVLGASLTLALAVAQTASAQYTITRLTADQAGQGRHTDPNLVNAWGLAFGPGGPFWLSDNGTGVSTLYDSAGASQGLVVNVPSASGSGAGSPTGIVSNGTAVFNVTANGSTGTPFFLFATLDGTISGWAPNVDPVNAIIGANNSASGAVYTGLAFIDNFEGAPFLFAADNANNKVDIYDGSFNLVKSFTDPSVPAGFTPYGIQNLGGKIFVTYAGPGSTPGGVVDVFDGGGNLVKHLAMNGPNGPLNQPWGLAIAPSNFGQFSGAILVGNNTPTGIINAYDFKTAKFLGTLKGANGKPLVINQLWGLEFGGGVPADGQTNQLFFTAGPNNYSNGLFGVINSLY
jgi:uncharacterized protein (TIGR03118 family)